MILIHFEIVLAFTSRIIFVFYNYTYISFYRHIASDIRVYISDVSKDINFGYRFGARRFATLGPGLLGEDRGPVGVKRQNSTVYG